MRISKALVLIAATVAALIVEPGGAVSQVFPSSRMTTAFQQRLNSLALSPGAAFVSSCFDPKGEETAVLIIPIGKDTGTLALLASHKMYNGAGVKLENNKLITLEGGGGEWSLRKLQFLANKLVVSDFRLEFGDQLRALIMVHPEHRCPRYVDSGPPSAENFEH